MRSTQHRLRLRGFEIVLGIVLLVGALFAWQLSTSVTAAADPVIVAAGDIACDPGDTAFNSGNGNSTRCHQLATYNLIKGIAPTAVLALGDDQYYCGGYNAFLQSYALSWGNVKSITHPVPGNHEYLTSGNSGQGSTGCNSSNANAAGYFKYYGAAAGDPTMGYYSYDIGTWHIIAINSSCSSVGGCNLGSPQEVWLKSDLAAHTSQCVMAYWHIPLWSSGGRAAPNTQTMMTDLYNAHADVVLTGHDHDYERFAPQKSDGTLDNALGVREFVVGTGGANHTSFGAISANSQVRNSTAFGVLKVTLHPTSYDWKFVPEAGQTFTDSGTAGCHNTATPPTNTPIPPTPTSTPIGAPTATNTPVPPAPTNTPTAPTPTSTPSGTGTTTTFTAAADAYVDSSNPTVNNGTGTTLRIDGSPVINSYIKFNVSGLTGTVQSATLRIFANSSLSGGYLANGESDSTWGETTLTYSNAPAPGAQLGTSGAVSTGTWTSVTVTGYITGNGTWSFVLTDPSATALSLASRESGANAPQLVITTQ